MNGKTYIHYLKSYLLLNGLLKEYASNLRKDFQAPEIVSLDCEASRIKAVRNVWPSANILVCYFHVIKNIWMKAGKLNLKNKTILFDETIPIVSSFKLILNMPRSYENIEKIISYLGDLSKKKPRFRQLIRYF